MCKTFHECCYYIACPMKDWWVHSSCTCPIPYTCTQSANYQWSVHKVCLMSLELLHHQIKTLQTFQIQHIYSLRYVKVAIASQLERSCHTRKRTEIALKPTYTLSWKLSELSSHTNVWTLTDKWQHTEELYHHSPLAHGPICAHASCSLSLYTTITQFKPQGEGPNWPLHTNTSPPMATCMAIGYEGSWMGSIAHVAETPWCIHIYTRIMPCTDTRMQDTEMLPHTHTCILYTCGSRELKTQIISEVKVEKMVIEVDVAWCLLVLVGRGYAAPGYVG